LPRAYQLNSARITTREYLYGTPWVLLPVIWLLKLFRIRLPGSTDDPPIDSLESFVVEESELPEEIRSAWQSDLETLRRRGFTVDIFHLIPLPHVSTTIYRATLTDGNGVVARLQRRIWTIQPGPRDTRQFETEFTDGRRVITFSGKRDMIVPRSWDFSARKSCDVVELLEEHRERVQKVFDAQRIIVHNEQELVDYGERQHRELVEFHVGRGVFEPATATASEVAPVDVPDGVSPEDATVLAELQQLGQNKVSLSSMGWGLAISLAAFAAVFFAQQGGRDLKMLWMIIPILIVHESGHWVAMNAFGYKNMRMFFIPFFGAAVSGRNLNVSGWKKAAVALMGPVPSIVLSILLLVQAIRFDLKWVLELSLMALVVNLFNLVPILPLDGGQLLQAVLFSRSRFLDVLARLLAAGSLFMLGVAIGEWVLMLLAGFMAVGIPLSYRLAKLTEDLRDEEGLSLKSPDGVTVPTDTALTIARRVRSASKVALAPKVLAQQTMSVFENLNARPPGALATIGLLTVYVGSILIAIVGIGVAALAQAGHLDRMLGRNDNPFAALGVADTPLACHGTEHLPAADPATLADRTLLIHATDEKTALADLDALGQKYGDSERVLFGQTIAWTPAEDDASEVDSEFTVFEKQGRRVQVLRGGEPLSLALVATAPEQQAAFIEKELVSYSASPAWLNLLPPWSKEWTESPELPHWRKMRALLNEVVQVPSETYAEQDQELWKERADAARRRDEKRVAEIDKRMTEARAKKAESRLAELRSQHEDADSQKLIDAATPYVLEMFASFDENAEFDEAEDRERSPGEKSLADVRELLGARPDEPAGQPVPDEEAIAGTRAWASRAEETLNINITTPRSGAEIVAFVDWLCAHDCRDLHYDIWGLTNEFGNLEGFEGFEE